MKPHLRLHVTRTGDWWVGLSHPKDKGYTVSSTLNYVAPADALCAARRAWPDLAGFLGRSVFGAHFGAHS